MERREGNDPSSVGVRSRPTALDRRRYSCHRGLLQSEGQRRAHTSSLWVGLDGNGRDGIIEIRFAVDGCYKSATSGAVDVTDEFRFVFRGEDDKPGFRCPQPCQSRMLDGEKKPGMTSLGELIAGNEVSAGQDVEPVGLSYLREGCVLHGGHYNTGPFTLVKSRPVHSRSASWLG